MSPGFLEIGMLGVLVFAPLAYGTVEPWSQATLELAVLALATGWLVGMVRREHRIRVDLPPGSLPVALFLLLIGLQVVPLPAPVAGLLSPRALDLAREAHAFIGTSASLALLSVTPYATEREGAKLAAVAVGALLLYNVCRSRAAISRVVWTMTVTGTLIAIVGIVQRVTWNGHLYWIGPAAPHDAAFGPFVNRAHFAGLVGLVVPVALAVVLGGWRAGGRGTGWIARIRRWGAPDSGPASLIPFCILMMAAAALTSGSRMGVVTLMAALIVMVGLGGGRNAGRRAASALVLVVAVGLWIGGEALPRTLERFAGEMGRPGDSTRVQLWGDAIGLWRDAPVAGTGLASFDVVFPSVRTLPGGTVFTHAESDWVQLLTDTGLLGVLLMTAALALVFRSLLRAYRQAEHQYPRVFALAGLVALGAAVVQGVGTYSVPVMSNWFYLAAALVVALRASDPAVAPAASATGGPRR